MPKREFSRAIRLLVLVLVTAAGFLGPIAMTAYYPGLEQISSDLQTSQEVLDLTVTVFTLSLAVFPLLWGVLSDWLGRKPMYLASLGSFAVGSLLCGLSVNIGMLVAFRVMQGAGSAAMLSIGAGTITDVFPQSQRGAAMALLSIGPLVGPSIAGPLGGVMTQFAGWRSVFYLSAGLGFAILAAITAFLPETGVRGRGSAPNPLKPLIYLKYPFVAVATLNVVVGYGISFAVLPDIPYLFTSTYDDVRDGLVLLAMTGGQLVGSLVSGFLSDRILRMVAKRGRGAIEDALWPALPSIVLLPGMLSVFGWSFTQKWHPSIPIISLIIMGSAMTAIATPCNTYIIDVIYWSPAAAVAIGSSFRYVIGAASPLATPPLIRSIGIGWTYTAFALAAFVAGAGLPWVVLRGADSRMKHRQWKKAPGGAKGESKKDVK
ncbi:major facilitator superfamily domain-containing protein [Hyaloraphidium curvatum]|nr:major facilitator superfamily domain-containing protein [Hyaloraphidium curvatum]